MMLYILYSHKHDRHYIGITKNIITRLQKHNTGSVRSTKAYRPWELLHQEIFENKREARKRELFLKKNGREREKLIQLLHHGPIV